MVAASSTTIPPEEAGPLAPTITVLGIASAQRVFPVVGMDDFGPVVLRKRRARRELLRCIAHGPPRRRGMEACGSAHDGARCCRAQGPDGRFSARQCINASGQSPQHDAREAEAIGDAVTRPTMRVVPLQRLAPPALQARQRMRARRLTARTALVQELRGRLSEDGLVRPQRLAQCRAWLVAPREADQAPLTPWSPEVCWHLYEAVLALEQRVAYAAEQLTALGPAHPDGQRRQTIAGLGPVTATARSAALGAVPHGKHGRQLAAWLGLGPRAHATGGQPRRRGSRTRGARALRQRLGQGARATLRWVDTRSDARRRWLSARSARRGTNRAAVALAHQTARMVWALLAHHQEYRVRTVI